MWALGVWQPTAALPRQRAARWQQASQKQAGSAFVHWCARSQHWLAWRDCVTLAVQRCRLRPAGLALLRKPHPLPLHHSPGVDGHVTHHHRPASLPCGPLAGLHGVAVQGHEADWDAAQRGANTAQ